MTKEEASRWYEPGGFTPEPTDRPYNGWSNYKTWATGAWLTSDEESYDSACASPAQTATTANSTRVEHPLLQCVCAVVLIEVRRFGDAKKYRKSSGGSRS
jgi:hypothetical protein